MIQASISVAMVYDHQLRANKIFGIKKSSDKSNKSNHFFTILILLSLLLRK
jgi:hypothetical protein